MKLILVSSGKKSGAAIDGDTATIVDLLRKTADTIEHGDGKAVGVGIAVVFANATIATTFEEGPNPFQLMGACDELKYRIHETTNENKL